MAQDQKNNKKETPKEAPKETAKEKKGEKKEDFQYIVRMANRESADEYIDLGYTVRPVTLEDIFISRGVEIES